MDFSKKLKSIKDTLSYSKNSFNYRNINYSLIQKSPYKHRKFIVDNAFGEKEIPDDSSAFTGSGIKGLAVGEQGGGRVAGGGGGAGHATPEETGESTGAGSKSQDSDPSLPFDWTDLFWPDVGGVEGQGSYGKGTGGGGGSGYDYYQDPNDPNRPDLFGRNKKVPVRDPKFDFNMPEDYLKEVISNWDQLTEEEKKALIDFFNKVGKNIFNEIIKSGKKVKINFKSEEQIKSERKKRGKKPLSRIIGWFDGDEIYIASEIFEDGFLDDFDGNLEPWEVIAHEFGHLLGLIRFGIDYSKLNDEWQEWYAWDFVNELRNYYGKELYPNDEPKVPLYD